MRETQHCMNCMLEFPNMGHNFTLVFSFSLVLCDKKILKLNYEKLSSNKIFRLEINSQFNLARVLHPVCERT